MLHRETCFALAKSRQCGVPPRLELPGDEAVVRVHALVPTSGDLDLVLGVLARQLQCTAALIVLCDDLSLGHEGSFYRDGLDGKKNLARDRLVWSTGTERDAPRE